MQRVRLPRRRLERQIPRKEDVQTFAGMDRERHGVDGSPVMARMRSGRPAELASQMKSTRKALS